MHAPFMDRQNPCTQLAFEKKGIAGGNTKTPNFKNFKTSKKVDLAEEMKFPGETLSKGYYENVNCRRLNCVSSKNKGYLEGCMKLSGKEITFLNL